MITWKTVLVRPGIFAKGLRRESIYQYDECNTATRNSNIGLTCAHDVACLMSTGPIGPSSKGTQTGRQFGSTPTCPPCSTAPGHIGATRIPQQPRRETAPFHPFTQIISMRSFRLLTIGRSSTSWLRCSCLYSAAAATRFPWNGLHKAGSSAATRTVKPRKTLN